MRIQNPIEWIRKSLKRVRRRETLRDFSVLEYATVMQEVDLFRLAMSQNSPVNARAADGCTPLHWAAMHGNGEMVRALLLAGANANALSGDGYTTPIALAHEGGHEDIVEVLKNAGATLRYRGPDTFSRAEWILATLWCYQGSSDFKSTYGSAGHYLTGGYVDTQTRHYATSAIEVACPDSSSSVSTSCTMCGTALRIKASRHRGEIVAIDDHEIGWNDNKSELTHKLENARRVCPRELQEVERERMISLARSVLCKFGYGEDRMRFLESKGLRDAV